MLDIIENKLKAAVLFYLIFFPFECMYCAYPQIGTDLNCAPNLESIFKVHDLKIRYEIVKCIYERCGTVHTISQEQWNRYFKIIKGYPLYVEEQKGDAKSEDFVIPKYEDLKPEDFVSTKCFSDEEIDSYIEQLGCTPEQALNEYKDFIQTIKSQKEIYLKCISEELAKNDSSEYVKAFFLYGFIPPGGSLTPSPGILSRLDFLQVFKEFIFNKNEDVLPDGIRVAYYLNLDKFVRTYSQTEEDRNIENIFKAHYLKIKYECVQYIYDESKKEHSPIHDSSIEMRNHYFELIKGYPLTVEEQKEDINSYIEQLSCTPEQTLKEYKDFIQKIKSEKEIYLKCINAELTKGNLSKYANESIAPYFFSLPAWLNMLPRLSRLDFLQIFKEFILVGNEDVLPEWERIVSITTEVIHHN
jgi:hypothetical protein